MAVIFIVKVNPVNSLICIRTCLFQGIAKCCHAEDTASVCHDLAIFELRSCMEAVIALMLFERLESGFIRGAAGIFFSPALTVSLKGPLCRRFFRIT